MRVLLFLCLLAPVVLSWPYGEVMVRGVNLGGWLVLEKWMTPAVFEGLPDWVNDEYQFTEYLGYQEAENRLRAHWDSWVTEQDIINLKNAGLNHIRIPIGYWALDIKSDEPWVWGSWQYAIKACEWARTHGLQVMIDLHGAPGSQNGNDHSGQSGEIRWFYSDENIARTVSVLGQIARFANAPEWREVISIIQLINEPVLWDDYDYRLQRLKDFTRQAYDEIRKYNDIAVIAVHDAFISLDNWYYLRDDEHYYWVMLDTHIYQVFTPEWQDLPCEDHYYLPCRAVSPLAEANAKLWTVVGEWSLATPHICPNQPFFAQQQLGVYEVGSGWFFWSFKQAQSPNWDEWDFTASVRNNWIKLDGSNNHVC